MTKVMVLWLACTAQYWEVWCATNFSQYTEKTKAWAIQTPSKQVLWNGKLIMLHIWHYHIAHVSTNSVITLIPVQFFAYLWKEDWIVITIRTYLWNRFSRTVNELVVVSLTFSKRVFPLHLLFDIILEQQKCIKKIMIWNKSSRILYQLGDI